MGGMEPNVSVGRVLAKERLNSVLRLCVLRLGGMTVFLALGLVLRALGTDPPAWRVYTPILAVYWVGAAGLYALARFAPRYSRLAGLGTALVDVPMVFWLQ